MTPQPKSNYLPYIDGCRAIAILFVVLSHAGLEHIIPGKFGVTLFFFISGFLITSLLIQEKKNKGTIQIGNFYLRRFFRLYPALLCMVAISCLTAFFMGCALSIHDITGALFYYTNYYIGWFRQPVPDCSRVLDILWSLSVEEHFYLFYPLFFQLVIATTKAQQVRRFIALLLILCIASILLRWQLYNSYNNTNDIAGRIYFSSHTRMDSILWGCCCAAICYCYRNKILPWLQQPITAIIGCALLLLSVAWPNFLFKQIFQFTIQGIGLLLIIPFLQTNQTSIPQRILSSTPLIFIGKISYSLYLFHWVVSKLANHLFTPYGWQWQLLFWPAVIVLTLSSYYLVEKPFVALRKKFGSHVG